MKKDHKHILEHTEEMYSAGGHVSHHKEYDKHSKSHTMFHEHLKKMASGGCVKSK